MMRAWMLGVVCSLTLWAQPPQGFFSWWDAPFAKELNLTPDQQSQVRDILRDYRKRLVDDRAAVQKAEIDIQTLMEADNFDQKAATAALERLVQARADMTRSLTEMSFKLRMVLTPEQWKQVRQRAGDRMRQRILRDRPQEQRLAPRPGPARRGPGMPAPSGPPNPPGGPGAEHDEP